MVPGIPMVQPNANPLLNKDKDAPIRTTFGKLYPKEKKEKGGDKKKAAAKKAAPKKKDEKPPKPILWEAEKGPRAAHSLDLMRNTTADIEAPVFPMNLKQESCNVGVMPTIIKEVFMPPDAPSTVATLIESSLVYQNSANYEMAVHSLEQARDDWRKLITPVQRDAPKETTTANKNKAAPAEPARPVTLLRPEQELYFELSLGSIYESCGKDDIAISCYMKARAIKLVSNHPDQAFAYCCLGSVMYHIDEPAWALRCYLKARKIREERLGGDTVDSATVYNNLGATMYMLERNQECKAYF